MVFHPHRPCLFLFLFLFIVLLVHPVQAWDGVVIRVVDGDTLLAAPKNATHPEQAALGIRLYGIDAPELNQPGTGEAIILAQRAIRHSAGNVFCLAVLKKVCMPNCSQRK